MRREIETVNDANKDLRDTAAEEEASNTAKQKLKVWIIHCPSFVTFYLCHYMLIILVVFLKMENELFSFYIEVPFLNDASFF